MISAADEPEQRRGSTSSRTRRFSACSHREFITGETSYFLVPVSTRTWPTRTLNVLLPIVGIDLVIQYITGLGTSAYAPPAGFNMNTDFGIYNVHWLNGYVLGILSIILVVVAVLSRQARNVVPSVVTLVTVIIAAVAGMAFVSSAPNPPAATVAMGVAFILAFSSVLAMMFRVRMAGLRPGAAAPMATPPA